MASKHTEKYLLNQWEGSDQVVRTDFNEDNLKIETALAGHDAVVARALTRAQEITSMVMEEMVTDISVDLSGIDWGEWEYVALTFDQGRASDVSDGSDGMIYCYLNQGGVPSYSSAGNSLFARSRPNPILILLLPHHDAQRHIEGICIGSVCSFGVGNCAFSDLTSFRFALVRSTGSLAKGTKIEVWGVK